jgi:hypothetical protein
MDGDSVRVVRSRQSGRVTSVADAGNLRGGEGNDSDVRVVAIHRVEVVEISTGCAQYQDAGAMVDRWQGEYSMFESKPHAVLDSTPNPRSRNDVTVFDSKAKAPISARQPTRQTRGATPKPYSS